jgi:hypothetical protein
LKRLLVAIVFLKQGYDSVITTRRRYSDRLCKTLQKELQTQKYGHFYRASVVIILSKGQVRTNPIITKDFETRNQT